MALFPHHPAVPAHLDGVAQQGRRAGGMVTDLVSDLGDSAATSRSAVSGDLAAPMANAPAAVIADGLRVSAAAIVLQECMHGWSTGVTDYNCQIDVLNVRAAPLMADIGSVIEDHSHQTPEEARRQREENERLRAELRAVLHAEKVLLDRKLDEVAERISELLLMPVREAISELIHGGLIPGWDLQRLRGMLENFEDNFSASLHAQYWPPGGASWLEFGEWAAMRGLIVSWVASDAATLLAMGHYWPSGIENPVLLSRWQRYLYARFRPWIAKEGRELAFRRWLTFGKWAGRGFPVVTAMASGTEQWKKDLGKKDMDNVLRGVRILGAAGLTTAAVYYGAGTLGAEGLGIGFLVGTALGGPPGAAAGGMAGALIGGFVGGWIGYSAATAVVDTSYNQNPPPAPRVPSHVTVPQAPTPVPVPRPPVQTVVQSGDSLWRIAERQLPSDAAERDIQTRVDLLYRSNHAVIGPDPDVIRPHRQITLPAG